MIKKGVNASIMCTDLDEDHSKGPSTVWIVCRLFPLILSLPFSCTPCIRFVKILYILNRMMS